MKSINKLSKLTLVFLLILGLCLPLFAACKKKDSGETGTTKVGAQAAASEHETEAAQEESKAPEIPNQVFEIDGDNFELAAANLILDSDGDTDLVTTWKFTNNGDEEKSAAFTWYYTFKQGDQQVYEPGIIPLPGDSTETLADYDDFSRFKPGETGTIFLCLKLVDEETPVTITLSGFITEEKHTIEIPIKDMEIVTADVLAIPKG